MKSTNAPGNVHHIDMRLKEPKAHKCMLVNLQNLGDISIKLPHGLLCIDHPVVIVLKAAD